jgi:TPR repeat protein
MSIEIKEYIGSKIPKNYSNFEANNIEEAKSLKPLWHRGRNYYKLGTATKSLTLSDRIWLGISALFKTIITLKWSRNKNDLCLAWKGGEGNVTLYTNSHLLSLKKQALQIDAQPNPGHEGMGHLAVAVAYERGGNRVKPSLEKAIKYYKKSAEMNCPDANFNLGRIYYKNSVEEAIKFFEIASEQGNLNAQIKLGEIYSNFRGPYCSYEKALHNLKKAESQGAGVVHYYLGRLYRFRLSNPNISNNRQEVEKLVSESIKHFELAIIQGNVDALFELGETYDHIVVNRLKNDPPTNNAKAVGYYRQAAEKGHVRAQYILGTMHKLGRKVEKSEGKAIEYFRKAADQGYELAFKSLPVDWKNHKLRRPWM